MRFLVDEGMPRSSGIVLQAYGHDAEDVRDIGLKSAADIDIAAYAKLTLRCIVTRDLDFSDIRSYPPGKRFGILVLRPHHKARGPEILALLEGFLGHEDIVSGIVGTTVIVDSVGIRIRTQ